MLEKKLFLDPVILYQTKRFRFQDRNLYWNTSFRFRLGIFVKWCRTFFHVIKLIKYHVTKRPGRSPGARLQRRDSMSEPGKNSAWQRFRDGIESLYSNINFRFWKRNLFVWLNHNVVGKAARQDGKLLWSIMQGPVKIGAFERCRTTVAKGNSALKQVPGTVDTRDKKCRI